MTLQEIRELLREFLQEHDLYNDETLSVEEQEGHLDRRELIRDSLCKVSNIEVLVSSLESLGAFNNSTIEQQENDPWLDEPWTVEELKSFDNLEHAEEWK
jgi:hypothetical protein